MIKPQNLNLKNCRKHTTFLRTKKNEKNTTSWELTISTIKMPARAEALRRDNIITIIPAAALPVLTTVTIIPEEEKDLTSRIYFPTFLTGREENRVRQEETI